MLVTASDRGDNKGQRAAHSLITWLTFTASILYLVVLIPLNFSYDIAKIVLLIVTKSRTDTTIQCSVTTELNMQFCNGQTRAQPLFSPPCASATYGNARMRRRKNTGPWYALVTQTSKIARWPADLAALHAWNSALTDAIWCICGIKNAHHTQALFSPSFTRIQYVSKHYAPLNTSKQKKVKVVG